jgi:hypothetical protein
LATDSTVTPSAELRASGGVAASVVAALVAAAGVEYWIVAVTAIEAAATSRKILDGDTPICAARATRKAVWLKLDTSPATAKVALTAVRM